ncbi:MAG TPA: glycosyltransferase family 1 protein [Pyrinomonadaceae bacterium]|jgi:glycosyltransferase involved in cell wall biosynthesis
MQVGVDIHMCRLSQSGLFTYIRNLLHELSRLEHPHDLKLFLYGHPDLEEPEQVRRLAASLPRAELRYVWDAQPPALLSGAGRGAGSKSPTLGRRIDRRLLLPLWRKMLYPNSRPSYYLSRVAGRLRKPEGLGGVDVFHHPAGLVFPLNARANVMTLSDLIPRHFPYYCQGSDEWFEESFERAHEMDVILTYSEHTKRDVVETLGVEAERIHVAPLAAHEQYRPDLDPERLREVLGRHGLGGRPYVIYTGMIGARKNLARLVEAFHVLRQEAPSLGHRLVLAGGTFQLSEPIFETVRALGMEGDVKWLGFVPFEDLPYLLGGAELFAFPSLYEGFGLPPLEAMACGTPVVCSSASSLPEVVGDAGLLFDPYKVNEMAESMHRVLADAGLRAELSRKGLERARLFSWEKTARLTLAAYEEAFARAKGDAAPPPRRRAGQERTKNYPHAQWWVVEQLARQINE